jgi:hypothetical protein
MKQPMLKLLLAGTVFSLHMLAFAGSVENPDLILFNGKIITVDPQGNIFTAMAEY